MRRLGARMASRWPPGHLEREATREPSVSRGTSSRRDLRPRAVPIAQRHRVDCGRTRWAAAASAPRAALSTMLALAVLATLPASSLADGALVGETSVQHKTDRNRAGLAEAFSARAAESGRIDRLNVYLSRQSSASRVLLGLYSSKGAVPSRRLVSCRVASPRAARWNACS